MHLKYIEYLITKTLFSHQYTKNISNAGQECEEEIRFLFRNILSKRFHVTHGYIVAAENIMDEPLLSPQIDLIIVDTLVPHSLFLIGKEGESEIVPIESVVGIFEIKRTLSRDSLVGENGALNHLKKIINSVNLKKDNPNDYLSGGIITRGITGGLKSNPLIGILSIDHDSDLYNQSKTREIFWKDNQVILPELDIVASLSGFIMATADPINNQNFKAITVREPNLSLGYKLWIPEKEGNELTHKPALFAAIFGFIQHYLYLITGRHSSLENYFYNKTLIQNNESN